MKFDAEYNSDSVCTGSDVHRCGHSPYEWSLAQAQLHNCCICRQGEPTGIWEHMQDCAIVTVWCELIQALFVLLQIGLIDQQEGGEILFQVPDAPPHFGHEVRCAVNAVLGDRDGPHEVRTSRHGMYPYSVGTMSFMQRF